MLHYWYMLNVVPIQFLALFAYLLLRVTIGIVLLILGTQLTQHALSMSRIVSYRPYTLAAVGILCLISSGLLILGLFTQIGALFVVSMAAGQLLYPNHTLRTLVPHPLFWLLLLGAGLTLFITGAGALAFDLPI